MLLKQIITISLCQFISLINKLLFFGEIAVFYNREV